MLSRDQSLLAEERRWTLDIGHWTYCILIARYVSKANEQETRLEQLEAERRTTIAERARLQGELDLAIRSLSLDHKL